MLKIGYQGFLSLTVLSPAQHVKSFHGPGQHLSEFNSDKGAKHSPRLNSQPLARCVAASSLPTHQIITIDLLTISARSSNPPTD